MNIDLIKLKALATAAAANQYDAVALNDYGTALPPATVLGLIAEIERHRLVNAEGCKPDSNLLLGGLPCTGFAPRRSLDKAEGCKPDHNFPIHTDDMAAITKWHSEFLQLTDYGWPDDVSALQDQAYALGRTRGQDDWLAERLQASAALREDIKRGERIQIAMASDLSAIAQALGIPPEEQQGGAPESIAAIKVLQTQLTKIKAVARNVLAARDADDAPHGHPGHQHAERGRWDSTGAPCQECAAYDQLASLSASTEPSTPMERTDLATQVPLTLIRESMESSAIAGRASELQIGEVHLRVTYHGIKWYHDRRHCNRWEPLSIEEFDGFLRSALMHEVQP